MREAKKLDGEILNVVKALGGNSGKYRRERSRAIRAVVSEIYSPPRVTAAARRLPHLGVLPGFAMDLRNGWDFDNAERRREARRLIGGMRWQCDDA